MRACPPTNKPLRRPSPTLDYPRRIQASICLADTIEETVSLLRKSLRSPTDYIEGGCATFAYAMMLFLKDIQVPATADVLYRSLVECESGETSEIIFSHCVVSAAGQSFDINGGPNADDRWIGLFDVQEEVQGELYDVEWHSETFSLHQHNDLCCTALGAQAGFDYNDAYALQIRLMQIYFKLITKGG